MVRTLVLAVLALCCAEAGIARAADQPRYAPPPAWVKPVPIPQQISEAASGTSAQVLLQNVQSHFTPDGDEFFQETAIKILTAQGLNGVGSFILPWRPDTSALTIHRLQIIRGDQVIDLLQGGKNVTVLRRETNLELSMLDGALTATVQPEGVQVGDVIDVAYTIKRADPVYQGRSEGFGLLMRPGVIGRAYFRAVWPNAKPIRWKASAGLAAPTANPTAEGQELVFDQTNVEAPKAPLGAPARYSNIGQLQFSQFASWSEVSALMAPLFAKAATTAPNSPLQAEIDKIAAASSDPKVRAMAALKLVQEQVRYVLLAMNNGGYVPADADVTWARRFGDCKGKTALLLALLHGLGVQAQPTLISTVLGDGLDERLPTLALFDHVMVKAQIGGKTYWMDGTREGDLNLDDLPTPNFHWTLPVQAQGADLVKLAPEPFAEPHVESIAKLDATGGLDVPAPAHVDHIFRGDEAIRIRLSLQSAGRADVEAALRNYWRSAIPWVDPKDVSFSVDPKTGATTLSVEGSAKIDWTNNGAVRDFAVGDSSLGFNTNLDREPGPGQDAPYAINFPRYIKRTVIVQLPNKGAGFLLMAAEPVDKIVAGMEFRRQAHIAGGVATVEADERSLVPEFPASQARAAAATLRQLAEYDIVIRAIVRPTGRAEAQTQSQIQPQAQAQTQAQTKAPAQAQAQVQTPSCAAKDSGATIQACSAVIRSKAAPPDARLAAYLARGLAYGRNHQFELAASDFAAATRLKPDLAEAFVEKGAAEAQMGKLTAGLADLDQAIRLKPALTPAWLTRAGIHARQGDMTLALADSDEAIRLSPAFPAGYLERGSLYAGAKDYDHAVHDFDQAIKLKPDDAAAYGYRAEAYENLRKWDAAMADFDKLAEADPFNPGVLNSQCWTRAEANEDLDNALGYCEAAIKISPRSPDIFDSRAFVRLRRGELDQAVADYDAALKIDPKLASSLFGRGVAERRMGRTAAGDADIAAAKALDAKVAETYAAMGVTP